MTKDEAIEYLNTLYMALAVFPNQQISLGNVDEMKESVSMAIQALSQEPCEDAVSRGVFEQVMWERDIAIEQLHELGYELGQKIEPCDDAVSRQAVIKDFTQWRGKMAYSIGEDYSGVSVLDKAIQVIKGMPSVTQKPKTGQWIEKDGFDGDVYYDCSECGESWTTIEGTPWDNEWNYCPNCGCRMVEPQERSGEE